jgi:hypothetical protein
MKLSHLIAVLFVPMAALAVTGCGDDDDEGLSQAQRLGVGSECTTTVHSGCLEGQQCLTMFKGGYCGLQGCTGDVDCPGGSACVAHADGNFCFLICLDKPDCNGTRSLENEANCVSNIDFVGGAKGGVKVCVPPSSG